MKKEMDKAARERVEALLKELEAVDQEARHKGAPVAPIPSASWLVPGLQALLSGQERPLMKSLGMLNSRVGLPGADQEVRFKKMRAVRELQGQGLSRADAAEAAGVDERTLSRWQGQALGYAEEIDARLSGLPAVKGRKKVKDKTGV